MSFTSLLPPPKHSKSDSNSTEKKSERLEETIKALVDYNNRSKLENQDKVNIETSIGQRLSFKDVIPIRQSNFNFEIPKPSEKEIAETYTRTKQFFDNILMKSLRPESSVIKSSKKVNDNAHQIEYGSVQSSGGRRSRMLTVVDQAKDPLQPNTIKTSKVVAPSEEDDIIPIYHKSDDSDSVKKLSKEERDKWKIPAAISSWKNPKGYTIPLETRLAMDGRYSSDQMEGHEISDGFAKVSLALEAVDRKARQEIKLRAEAKRRIAEEETIKKEERLIELAQKARQERLRDNVAFQLTAGSSSSNGRDANRMKRKQQLVREFKKSKMSTADRLRELAYSQGRDISEKVVLNAAKASESNEVHYDSRLFSKGANAKAKRNEEQLYDQPLFASRSGNTIYSATLGQMNSSSTESHSKKSEIDEPIQFTEAQNDT